VVEVAPVVPMELAETQPTLGTITPTRRATLGSAVDGRVIELMVREGDRVEENQPLAKLLTQTIELELEAAEAELELRKEELTELQNGNRPEEIAQAKARLEASGIAARFLEKNKERLTELSQSNAVPLADLESSLSLWLEAQQRNLEAQSAYQLAVQGARPEKIKQAQMRIAAAKALAERLRDQLGKHTLVQVVYMPELRVYYNICVRAEDRSDILVAESLMYQPYYIRILLISSMLMFAYRREYL
ncbi:MAG: hypothetical protein ACKN9U_05330, partial [Pirellulaceae bacterium]